MNIERINKAIAVMERAAINDSINMIAWQSRETVKYGAIGIGGVLTAAVSEDSLHKCGNKACFAGYLAISPEWLSTPGFSFIPGSGAPIYNENLETFQIDGDYFIGGHAVAKFLGIAKSTVRVIIQSTSSVTLIYGKPFSDIRAIDVIDVLKRLKDIGEEAFMTDVHFPEDTPEIW